MRYSTVILAVFAAVAVAQDDNNPIEDLGDTIGSVAEDGIEVLTSNVVGGVTSVLDDISGEATDAANSLNEPSSSDEEEAAEDEAEPTGGEQIEEGSDQDSAVEEGDEDAEADDGEDAAAISAIPVLGAGIAGALAIVGML